MQSKRSIPSLIVFCLTIFCFTMPFITISTVGCASIGSVTLTGQQLAQGTHIFGKDIPSLPMAQAGAICAIVGILLSLFGRQVEKYLAIIAASGFTCLILLRATVESNVRKESMGLVNVKFELGYYLATLVLLAGAIVNSVAATRTAVIGAKIPVQVD
jgi:hypothetical protein